MALEPGLRAYKWNWSRRFSGSPRFLKVSGRSLLLTCSMDLSSFLVYHISMFGHSRDPFIPYQPPLTYLTPACTNMIMRTFKCGFTIIVWRSLLHSAIQFWCGTGRLESRLQQSQVSSFVVTATSLTLTNNVSLAERL